MLRRTAHRFLILTLAFVAILIPTLSVYALDYETLKFFADNNILYFDPTPPPNCSSTLDCNIVGNTRDEKLWSGLRNLGLTPEQTAAMMGNILHEGGSPTRQEDAYNIARNKGCESTSGPYNLWDDSTTGQRHTSCMQSIYSGYKAGSGVAGVGVGFVGWTARSVRLPYLELMKDAGLIKYFEGDAYKTYGSVSDDELLALIVSETGSEADYWALWCTALKYIYSQLTTPQNGLDYTKFFDIEGVENLTGYIAQHYEVCNGCQPGQGSYNARIATANEIFARYENGEFAAVESGTAPRRNYGSNNNSLSDGSNVTIRGELSEETTQTITKLLPKADFDGDASRTTVIIVASDTYTTPEIDQIISDIGDARNIIFISTNPENQDLLDAAAVKYDHVSLSTTTEDKLADAIADSVKDETSSLDNCPSTDGLVTDPSQAIAYLQQFIIDTNAQYGTNYALPPADLPINVAAETPADDSVVGSGGGCWGATYCGQCTALSGWFIQMMSGLRFGGTGNGRDTVSRTADVNSGRSAILSASNGEFPSGVAIFSMPGGPWGHTGVIMGRDGSSGDFITIENNQCNASGQCHRLEITTRSEASLRSLGTTFYPIDQVKTEHLGTSY